MTGYVCQVRLWCDDDDAAYVRMSCLCDDDDGVGMGCTMMVGGMTLSDDDDLGWVFPVQVRLVRVRGYDRRRQRRVQGVRSRATVR